MPKSYIVCGPPGAGKSSWVKQHAQFGDLIIDTDALFEAISGQPFYEKPQQLLDLVWYLKDAILDYIAEGRFPGYSVFYSMGGAKWADRENARLRFNPSAEVIIMERSVDQCLKNILNDERRGGYEKMKLWEPLVRRWWEQYER